MSNKKDLKSVLQEYLEKDDVSALEISDLIKKYKNEELIEREKKTKILLTTGAGNSIQGGSDIWVNHFINLVWPTLPQKKMWRLLIDSKRPTQFDPKSLPKGLQFHFHDDDPKKTDEWLDDCIEIHSLHSHYYKRPHIWHWEDKFKTIFVHAYPREMQETLDAVEELKRLQFNTQVNVPFYDEYITTFRKRVWIGLNPTTLYDEFPNYTYTIPNFYEFKHNLPLTSHVSNGKVGFASRAESRKCLHWLHGLKALALTSQYDVKNLRDTTTYTLPDLQLYQWDPKIHHDFMLKNWGIFHGAYFKEPFGYSIFQAVDYGKLPIIHTKWLENLDYKYRADNFNKFHKMVKIMQIDSYETRQKEFNKLKEALKKFDNKEVWVDKIRNILLR